MKHSSSTQNGAPTLVERVLRGETLRLPETPQRQRARELVEEGFYAAVDTLAGPDCARAIKTAGISRMHDYVPREQAPLVSAYMTHYSGNAVIRMGYDTMREDFEYEEDFHIEAILAYRIHYPYRAKRVPLPHSHEAAVDIAKPPHTARYSGAVLSKPYEDGHALHRDYWFDYALGTLNLWWAIEEVAPLNGMLLYPEMTVKNLAPEPSGKPYLSHCTVLTSPPQHTPLRKGELLVINSSTLHATQLNLSDSTRVVVSIRITPGTPTFHQSRFNRRKRFHKSQSIAANDFETIVDFASAPIYAVPEKGSGEEPETLQTIVLDADFNGTQLAVCQSSRLPEGGRLHVSLRGADVVVFRIDTELMAISARCPHEQSLLAGGYCDGRTLVCPSHGVTFDLRTGKSNCGLSTATYGVRECDGVILLSGPRG